MSSAEGRSFPSVLVALPPGRGDVVNDVGGRGESPSPTTSTSRMNHSSSSYPVTSSSPPLSSTSRGMQQPQSHPPPQLAQTELHLQAGSGMAGLAALSNLSSFGMGHGTIVGMGMNPNMHMGMNSTGNLGQGGDMHGMGMNGLAAIGLNMNMGMNFGVGSGMGIGGSGYSIPISNSRPGSRRNSEDEVDEEGEVGREGINLDPKLNGLARGWSNQSPNGYGDPSSSSSSTIPHSFFPNRPQGAYNPSTHASAQAQAQGRGRERHPSHLVRQQSHPHLNPYEEDSISLSASGSDDGDGEGEEDSDVGHGAGGVVASRAGPSAGRRDDSKNGHTIGGRAASSARSSGSQQRKRPGSFSSNTTGTANHHHSIAGKGSAKVTANGTGAPHVRANGNGNGRAPPNGRKSTSAHVISVGLDRLPEGDELDQDGYVDGDGELDGDGEGDGEGEGDAEGDGEVEGEGEGEGEGEDGDDGGLDADGRARKKQKLTRGSRACTVCRRLKMKCIEPDPEGGKPCKRCRNGNQECIFEESMRGKKSTRRKKLPDGTTPPLKSKKQDPNGRPGSTSFSQSPGMGHSSLYNPSGAYPDTSRSRSTQSPMGPPAPPLGIKQEEMYLPSLAERASLEKYHIRKPKEGMFGSSTLLKLLSEAPGLPGPPIGAQDYSMPPESNPLADHSGGTSSHSDHSMSFSGGPANGDIPTIRMRKPTSPRLDSLPDNALNPLGLLAEASLQNSFRKRSMNMQSSLAESSRQALVRNLLNQADAGSHSGVRGDFGHTSGVLEGSAIVDDEGEAVPQSRGVGDEHYFMPGPMTIVPLRKVFIGKEVQPEMLTFVNNEEVQELFDLYFDHLHIHVPVLDRSFHTPSTVCARSPFLMTVICAIASRFYTKRPELQARLATCANSLIFDVPAKGFKSLEVVQAYLLLTNFCLTPPERFEQDRTWLLLGLALRVATDLGLHRKIPFSNEDTEEGRNHDREVLNRERTWLNCFSSDRSYSAQMGKPYSIKEDFIIRNCTSLAWQSHPLVLPSDIAVANYCTLQRTMSRALDTLYSDSSNPSGLLTDCDITMIIEGFQIQLDSWSQSWRTQDDQTKRRQAQMTYDISGRFYYHYNSLVLNSFGLQNALVKSPTDTMFYFTKVYNAASAVCEIALKETAPRGLLKYGSDAHFVMTSYAILSLLKLIRPEFRSLHNRQSAILDMVSRVVDAMSEAAVDPYHTPALYATLLRSFIAIKAEEIKAEVAHIGATDAVGMDPSSMQDHAGLFGDGRKPSDFVTASNHGNASQGGFGDAMSMSGLPASTLSNWPNLTPMTPAPFLLPGQDFFGSVLPASPASRATQANTPFGGPNIGNGGQTVSSADPPGMSMDDYGCALGMEDFGSWDSSFLMPGLGLGQPELSGGLIHGAWGSGFISPNFGMTPSHSVQPTPRGSPQSTATQFIPA